MKFDSNLAWRQASATVSANRDVLLALAGVFFLLPRLVLSLFMPEPQSRPNMTPAEMADMLQSFYLQIAPYALPMMLFQAIGTLAMLTLFTDRSRPTVGQAIRQAARGLFPYLAAQFLLVLAVSFAGGLLIMVAGVSKQPALILLVAAGVIVAAVTVFLRMVLVAPVVAVERTYNPIRAIERSWHLTRGNALRICAFLLLIALVFMVAMAALVGVVGIVATLAMGPEGAKVTSAVISSVMAAGFSLYIAAILAAIHRQLAGPSAADISATFE